MTTRTLLHRVASGVLVVSLGLFGVACGDDDDDEAGGTQGTTATTAASVTAPQLTTVAANTITIQNFTFMGIDSTRANAAWTIVNQDQAPHTVSAVDGSFVWRVEAGQTGSFPCTLAPGSYPIKCDIHPTRMTGTLVVR